MSDDNDKKENKFKIKPETMRQAQDMMEGNTEALMTAPHYEFGKPNDTMFVRCHEETYPTDCVKLLEADGDDTDLTILMFNENHNDHLQLFKKLKSVIFVPTVTPQGKFFFWPLKQTHWLSHRPEHKAHYSARQCLHQAQKDWVKIWYDDSSGTYLASSDHEADFSPPKWPTEKWNMSMSEIFEASVSAKGIFISDINDNRLRRYRGEIE